MVVSILKFFFKFMYSSFLLVDLEQAGIDVFSGHIGYQ